MPAIAQTIREAPGDPALVYTWLGEEKMPDPMINPTINDSPLRYVNDLCFSSEALFRSSGPEAGAPKAEYPQRSQRAGRNLRRNQKRRTRSMIDCEVFSGEWWVQSEEGHRGIVNSFLKIQCPMLTILLILWRKEEWRTREKLAPMNLEYHLALTH